MIPWTAETPYLCIWIGNGIFVQLSQDSKKHLAFDRVAVVDLDSITFLWQQITSCCIRNPNGSFVFRNLLISAKFQRASQMNSIFVPPKKHLKKKQQTRSWWIPNSILRRLGSKKWHLMFEVSNFKQNSRKNTWKTKGDLNELLMREMRLGIEVHDHRTSKSNRGGHGWDRFWLREAKCSLKDMMNLHEFAIVAWNK